MKVDHIIGFYEYANENRADFNIGQHRLRTSTTRPCKAAGQGEEVSTGMPRTNPRDHAGETRGTRIRRYGNQPQTQGRRRVHLIAPAGGDVGARLVQPSVL